jgi:hypothetical protein
VKPFREAPIRDKIYTIVVAVDMIGGFAAVMALFTYGMYEATK